MHKINISHVNNMHNQWLQILNFYKIEFSIQKGILTEIAGKNTGADVMVQVEHFENQFKIQNNYIDILSHDIHENISKIARQAAASKAGYIDGDLAAEHAALGTKTEEQTRIATELVRDFRKFAEQWM